MKKPMKNFRDGLEQNIAIADEIAIEKAKGDVIPPTSEVKQAPATPPRAASISGRLPLKETKGKFFQIAPEVALAFEKTFEGSSQTACLNFALTFSIACAHAYRVKTGRPLEGNVVLDENFGVRLEQLSTLFGEGYSNESFNSVMEWAKFASQK